MIHYFLVIFFNLIISLCFFAASLLLSLSIRESLRLKEQLLSPSNKVEAKFPQKLILEFSSEFNRLDEESFNIELNSGTFLMEVGFLGVEVPLT